MPVTRDWHGTKMLELMQCLIKALTFTRSGKIAHPARENHPVSRAQANKKCSLYVFLVDIKLALGNNHRASPAIFSWNLHVAYVGWLQHFVAQ